MLTCLARRIVASLLAAGLLAAPAAAGIPLGPHTLQCVDPGQRIWFDRELPPPFVGCAMGSCVNLDQYDLHVDAKGNITGFLRLRVSGSVPGYGSINVPIEGPVKGKIRGRDGSAKQLLTINMSADVMGMATVIFSQRCIEEISPDGSVQGYCKGKGCVKGLPGIGCQRTLDPYSKQLPPADGAWSLALELPQSPSQKSLAGAAAVHFDDAYRAALPYTIKGKYTANKDQSRLSLKPANQAAKGSRLKLKEVRHDASSGAFCVDKGSFKIQGQRADLEVCE